MQPDCRLILGDAVEEMAKLSEGGIDAIISDPPYPEIDRIYGRLTEAEWWDLMMGVCREARRILKPTGSAVFILQPNSRKVGSMRGWLWEFMAWACREWNMVQDAWWWNTRAIPEAHAIQGRLMRPSMKACVWIGPSDCWRDQDAVLWEESESNKAYRLRKRFLNQVHPGGHHRNGHTICRAATTRGGVTPYNVIPCDHGYSQRSAGAHGHGAGTPLALADWWTRYICPPGGVCCDPFLGSGTMGLAAMNRGRSFVGIDKEPEYVAIASRRLAEARSAGPLFEACR